jgi:prepilin-type N-terminal cleavage/methylation domain-containing protein
MRVWKSDRGFTLIEVLMGVVILGTALAPVALLLSGGLQGAQIREESTRACYLAQEKMDEVLALDFRLISNGEMFSDWVAVPDSVFRYVHVMVNPSGSFDNRMKRIAVTVGTTTLTTYVTESYEP